MLTTTSLRVTLTDVRHIRYVSLGFQTRGNSAMWPQGILTRALFRKADSRDIMRTMILSTG